ncbi:AAA family ATPase [Brucella pituitosa]
MLTSLLALGFSVTAESIVLIDEPENSLHPQWQQDFMRTVLSCVN